MDNVEKYENELVKKSNEAYKMALEIINKPTIEYRTEGFLMFICNAWELIFKARIINRNNSFDSINFNGKNRTFGLEKCITILHSRKDDKIRNNLALLIQLRNTATHLFIPELDYKLSQSFQNTVNLYYDYCKKYYPNIQTIGLVSPFISIIALSDNIECSNALVLNKDAFDILDTVIEQGVRNTVTHKFIITKSKSEADIIAKISNDKIDEQDILNIKIIEKTKDVNITHPYSRNEILKEVKSRLSDFGNIHFNTHSINLIIKKFKIKDNSTYTYNVKINKSNLYKYSHFLIEYIYSLLVEKGNLSNLYHELLPKNKKN